MPETKLLLTVEEVAERLGIGRTHAYGYVVRGDIASIKLGRCRRVPLAALEGFVARLREGTERT